MGAEAYRGAAALAQSKYASPIHKARMAMLSPAPSPIDTTLATKDQIAATNSENAMKLANDFNPDAQLAMAQAQNLKNEVDTHSTKVERALSHATTTTRALLVRIRDALGKDSEAVKATDNLWVELERLFEVAKSCKAALPEFLEQQKDTMNLFQSSVINEAIQDSQDELNLQHKKVNLQHSLILEHQQAFLNYKEATEPKLKELTKLQERVSRLTLDKGLLKTELDNQVKASEIKGAECNDVKKVVDQLRTEAENLLSSKKKLESENKALQDAVNKVQDRLMTEQQASTDRSDQEIRRLTDKLDQGAKKIAGLENLVKSLQDTGNTKAKQYDALKQEHDAQQMKVKNQVSEFANLREENSTLAKRVESLKAESSGLSAARGSLQEQVITLKSDAAMNVEKAHKAEGQVKTLTEKVKKLETVNDELETENNELVRKEAELKQLAKTLELLKSENGKLSATVDALQKAPNASNSSDVDLNLAKEETKRCRDQVRAAEEQAKEASTKLQQWADLATRTYNEYKELIPRLKAAESQAAGAAEKDHEIARLQQELQSTKKSGQTNGTSALSEDAAYWKDKYDKLIEKC